MIKKSITEDFHISFYKGDLGFLKFVLDKYRSQLGYKSFFTHWIELEFNLRSVCRIWATSNSYSTKTVDVWIKKGRVPPRIMNLLHKDLMILRQKDETIPTLQKLFDEYLSLSVETKDSK